MNHTINGGIFIQNTKGVTVRKTTVKKTFPVDREKVLSVRIEYPISHAPACSKAMQKAVRIARAAAKVAVAREINTDYETRLAEIQASVAYDVLEMYGSAAGHFASKALEILQIFVYHIPYKVISAGRLSV